MEVPNEALKERIRDSLQQRRKILSTQVIKDLTHLYGPLSNATQQFEDPNDATSQLVVGISFGGNSLKIKANLEGDITFTSPKWEGEKTYENLRQSQSVRVRIAADGEYKKTFPPELLSLDDDKKGVIKKVTDNLSKIYGPLSEIQGQFSRPDQEVSEYVVRANFGGLTFTVRISPEGQYSVQNEKDNKTVTVLKNYPLFAGFMKAVVKLKK